MSLKDNIIGGLNKDRKIYRIFPRDRFFELFAKRKNALVRPEKWADPYENIILRSKVRNSRGEEGELSFLDDLYCQCWTLQYSSDAMWRIYSPERETVCTTATANTLVHPNTSSHFHDAVRVRTTVGRLLASLRDQNKEYGTHNCFIGKIEYVKVSDLKVFAREAFKNSIDNARTIARSVLYKRIAFEYEREVRLIYIECSREKRTNGVYKYRLDPYEVFDQVMIDPRMSEKDYRQYRDEIVTKTKFDKARIRHSTLYTPPKDFVVRIS